MYKFLFLTLSFFLLYGCAVVEGIDGGPRDITPPRVVKNGIHPLNGSTNFTASKIEFKFKEYIKLNNPSQTISIMPDNIQVDATVKGKSLLLNLKGALKENTTYQITMNGAVKDITEANDSLMQYVFSTGKNIDSLRYSGIVLNAKDLSPVKNAFVGLYKESDSAIYKKPLYYASSNENGMFTFNYLKAGNYTLYSFEDENKDSKWQKTERVAFLDHQITVDSVQKDTLFLHLFKQTLPTKLSANYTYPIKFTLSSTNPLEIKSLFLDSIAIPLDKINRYSNDSVSFIGFKKQENSYKLIVNHIGINKENKLMELSDTLTVRTPVQKKKGLKPSFDLVNSQNSYQNGDSIVFSFSDNLTSIDTSKLNLLILDSLKIPFDYSIKDNLLVISLKKLKGKLFNINCVEGGIHFENHNESFAFTRQFDITDESFLGVLDLDLSLLPSNVVVEVIKDNKVVKQVSVAVDGKKVVLKKLQPGNYSFKAFIDEDKNQQWTTGDFYTKTQPEKIIRFSKGVQVRSNWEIELILEPLIDDNR